MADSLIRKHVFNVMVSKQLMVYMLAIFLSAFLMFLLQPMIAKMILPYLGARHLFGLFVCCFFKALCFWVIYMPMVLVVF